MSRPIRGYHPPDLPVGYVLVLCPPGDLLAGAARGGLLVVEQDKPFDQLNTGRNCPGAVMHALQPSDLISQKWG